MTWQHKMAPCHPRTVPLSRDGRSARQNSDDEPEPGGGGGAHYSTNYHGGNHPSYTLLVTHRAIRPQSILPLHCVASHYVLPVGVLDKDHAHRSQLVHGRRFARASPVQSTPVPARLITFPF